MGEASAPPERKGNEMTVPHADFHSRRVVTGLNGEGRSTIVNDGLSDTRSFTPGWTLNDIWQIDSLPPTAVTSHTLIPGESALAPVEGGFVWRLGMFPPDSAWDPASQYRESLDAISAQDAINEDDPPGMHVTDTLDIVTILSGEIYVVLEECETLLRPGDTVVQRGTKHTWSNRSEEPCVLVIGITPLVR